MNAVEVAAWRGLRSIRQVPAGGRWSAGRVQPCLGAGSIHFRGPRRAPTRSRGRKAKLQVKAAVAASFRRSLFRAGRPAIGTPSSPAMMSMWSSSMAAGHYRDTRGIVAAATFTGCLPARSLTCGSQGESDRGGLVGFTLRIGRLAANSPGRSRPVRACAGINGRSGRRSVRG
jgi:hypothetical protein